ncbi:MAG: PEP-CTERM sorting domain-containing protein [Spirulina sp. SIO3F2]|nr:PEP-CTERM sorting domain-containing protein [Spirulina sp. SIO3F2]
MKSTFSNAIATVLLTAGCFVLNSGEAIAQTQTELSAEATHTNVMKAGEPLPILGAGLVLGMGMLLKGRQ